MRRLSIKVLPGNGYDFCCSEVSGRRTHVRGAAIGAAQWAQPSMSIDDVRLTIRERRLGW
jgi:hypothetical protein